ncbi:UV-endonuclease UvdE-domain-containing protein [Cyathus striatus]|nr:UV-endonuclease UvdE-domain-containing protein [Cyathus striatus]
MARKSASSKKALKADDTPVLRRSSRIKSISTVSVPIEGLECENGKLTDIPVLASELPTSKTVTKKSHHKDLHEQSSSQESVTDAPDTPQTEQCTVQISKRKRRHAESPTYVIPDIETKKTTFKGRLGYACINTVLRNKKPAREAIFCSRTCRIDTLKKNGMDWLKDIGRKNVQDLLKMIQWNEDNNIRFMRMSSEMFPFASHGVYGYSLDYCAPLLSEVGKLADKYGHRLTVHPGQFTQLGSPRLEVIESSIRELVYHCEMLDLMGLGVDSVMIIHGGGTYGDKSSALGRIKKTIKEDLPINVRNRLVLENDELCYSAEDLLPLCEELDIPLVFDYHHDLLNPSSIPPVDIIKRANAIWAYRGIRPKQHLSEPRPGAVTLMERRAHADRCESLPADLPDDMDLMIEAKDKEQAVLQLYRMYNLHPVNRGNDIPVLPLAKAECSVASLRPPNSSPTKETQGRKSAKRPRMNNSNKGRKKPISSDEETEDEGSSTA